MPPLNALIARNSTPETHGVTMGLAQSAGALGRIVGPMIAGVLFEVVAPGAPLASAAVMAAVVGFVSMMWVRDVRPEA